MKGNGEKPESQPDTEATSLLCESANPNSAMLTQQPSYSLERLSLTLLETNLHFCIKYEHGGKY